MKTAARCAGCVGAVLVVLALVAGSAVAQQRVVAYRDRLIVSAPLPGQSALDVAVRQKLDTTIVSFVFNEQPLQEAIDFLSTLGSVNIVVDRRQVEEGKTVTLKLTNVTLTTAIKLITEQVELKWIVRDGVVYISDEEGTKQEPVTVVYDVADLLAMPPDFKGPTIELQSIGSNRGGGTTGGGLDSIISTGDDPDDVDSRQTREELLQELVELIRTVIEPGTWEVETD